MAMVTVSLSRQREDHIRAETVARGGADCEELPAANFVDCRDAFGRGGKVGFPDHLACVLIVGAQLLVVGGAEEIAGSRVVCDTN